MTHPRRTLALCDIENLCLVAPDRASVEQLAAGLSSTDHVVVASHPNGRSVFAASSVFPGALLRVRHGVDGADTALQDEISDTRFTASRFDRVMIASGDGVFTESVVALNEAGGHTVVIAWPHKLSRRLRLATSEVRILTTGLPRDDLRTATEHWSA